MLWWSISPFVDRSTIQLERAALRGFFACIIIITFFLLFSYHYLFNKNKSCTKAVFLKLLLYCYGVILLNSFISSNCDLLIITRQIIIFSYILKKYSNFIGFWGHNMLNYYITRANLIMIDYYYAIKLWFLS